MQLDPHVLHLAIRWIHVAAMATAFGGAVMVLALSINTTPREGDAGLLDAATRYEWVFWAAAGVLAMTGIGNLATFGQGLPVPGTDWAAAFMAKLTAVIALVVFSIPRTLAVAGIRAGVAAPRQRERIRSLYGATAAAFAVILGLAVWLAHG
ncbi:MAG TPA: CopD family protein [Candidatus Limnocylindria bacterium]|jgi:putative copper export protein|nr:CopD family protein [Candidatus Limnocylindria bacterium]